MHVRVLGPIFSLSPLLCASHRERNCSEDTYLNRGEKMRAIDRKVPWGRSSDDCIARKREALNQSHHLKRLSEVRCVVDSREPRAMSRRQAAPTTRNADKSQLKIAEENRMLLERMDRIKNSPSRHSSSLSVLSADNVGVNDPVRRRRQRQIQEENRIRARRLKDLRPFYSREAMVQDHERQQQYLKSMSRAQKLALRLENQQAFSPQDQAKGRREQPTAVESAKSPSLVLRTAKQIRLDVAKERNETLPAAFSSRFSIVDQRLPIHPD